MNARGTFGLVGVRLGILSGCAVPLFVLCGCAPSFATAGIGSYEEFHPYATVVGNVWVELERPGYVAIISIHPQDPAFWTRDHVTFRVSYPAESNDSTYYPAGRHRLRYALSMRPMHRLCNAAQIPTIDGCRYYRQGSGGISGRISVNTAHYLVLVSAEPLDPYTVAYYLEEEVTYSSTLGQALHERNAETAALELATAIANAPGSPIWAAYYAVQK